MGQQIAHLQAILRTIIDVDIAYAIKTNEPTPTGAQNTTSEINLAAAGIYILNDDFPGIGIVICIQFILIAIIIHIPVGTAVNYLISIIALDCLIS